MGRSIDNARRLPREFFERHPRIVARQVLGKLLVRIDEDGGCIAGRIMEAEAYLGADDAAAHAAAGLTQRTAVLFGPAGHAYVYFTYGVHYCMNISCEPEGRAGCVLVRALEPVAGIGKMARNRRLQIPHPLKRVRNDNSKSLQSLCSGPARLCQALGIDRPRDNGKDLLALDSDLQLLDDGYKAKKVVSTTRVGITKAAELPLRFYLADSPFVSKK